VYGVSAAEFVIVACHGFPEITFAEHAVVLTKADSFPLPLRVFPSPAKLPAVAEMFARLLLDCRMGLWLMGLVPLA